MQHIENYFNNVDQIIGKKIYSLRLDKIELAQHDYP